MLYVELMIKFNWKNTSRLFIRFLINSNKYIYQNATNKQIAFGNLFFTWLDHKLYYDVNFSFDRWLENNQPIWTKGFSTSGSRMSFGFVDRSASIHRVI